MFESSIGLPVAIVQPVRLDDLALVGRIEANGHFARIGAVHTNTIEGFWSLVKRGVVHMMHKVSRRCLPLCVAEFQFRYNNGGARVVS